MAIQAHLTEWEKRKFAKPGEHGFQVGGPHSLLSLTNHTITGAGKPHDANAVEVFASRWKKIADAGDGQTDIAHAAANYEHSERKSAEVEEKFLKGVQQLFPGDAEKIEEQLIDFNNLGDHHDVFYEDGHKDGAGVRKASVDEAAEGLGIHA